LLHNCRHGNIVLLVCQRLWRKRHWLTLGVTVRLSPAPWFARCFLCNALLKLRPILDRRACRMLQGLPARAGRSTPLGHAPAGLQDFSWRQHLRLRLPSARLQLRLLRRCLLGGDLSRSCCRTLATQLPFAFGHGLFTQCFFTLPLQFAFCQLQLLFPVQQVAMRLDKKTSLLVRVQAQLDCLLEFQVQANFQIKKGWAGTRQHPGFGVQACLGCQGASRTSQLQLGR